MQNVASGYVLVLMNAILSVRGREIGTVFSGGGKRENGRGERI